MLIFVYFRHTKLILLLSQEYIIQSTYNTELHREYNLFVTH